MLKFQLRFSQNRVFADSPLQFSTAQFSAHVRRLSVNMFVNVPIVTDRVRVTWSIHLSVDLSVCHRDDTL